MITCNFSGHNKVILKISNLRHSGKYTNTETEQHTTESTGLRRNKLSGNE